jgi:small-conductance mechanosensitive channel
LLISSPVQNHSWSDRRLRVAQRLQVSYDADVERALAILREVAAAHPRAVPDPAPGAWLVSFAADGLELEVAWFVEDPENGTLGVRSDINREILRRFRAEGIRIPYAQRDLRIVSLPPIDISQAKADQSA